MKYTQLLSLCAITSTIPIILAQSIPADIIHQKDAHAHPQQDTMMNIPLPNFGGGSSSSADAGDVIISDVIGKDRVINIFAGFTRDIDAISNRLNDNTQNTTVLAPLNSEIQKLPRKPWEDPKEYESLGQSAYEGAAGEDRAHRNLRRFVEAHVIPASPWTEGEKVKSIRGEELWWEDKDGTRTVYFRNRSGARVELTSQRSIQETLRYRALRTRYQTEKYGSSKEL
ncbi:MAG: hypothetical protein L6R40_001353 [Gallowayella cf. fulva]|nr:MAG: hypothetical protein L6R40_001353 [Xanthomendoza cf. fulva]